MSQNSNPRAHLQLTTPKREIIGITIVDRYKASKLARVNWGDQFRLEKGGNHLVCRYCTVYQKQYDKNFLFLLPISLKECYLHNVGYDHQIEHFQGKNIYGDQRLNQRLVREQKRENLIVEENMIIQEYFEGSSFSSEPEDIESSSISISQEENEIQNTIKLMQNNSERTQQQLTISSSQIPKNQPEVQQIQEESISFNQNSNSFNGCFLCFKNRILYESLGCQHTACFDCWKKWLAQSKTCPFCRSNVTLHTLEEK